ncbi:MAG: hemolysin family protein [Desulfuromonadales bacterium]|nr:hemolysin family protein [Desulfuromonadales bacterium]
MDEASSKAKKSSKIMNVIGRFISGRKKITESELRDLMEASEEEGLINEDESEMIQAIFSLSDTVVREIMVPRTDVAFITSDASVSDILKTIIDCGHSRIPVYEGSIDNIIGILYAKDLLKYWGIEADSLDLKTVVRQPFFVPETKNLEELLQEFKKRRVHIAVVVDEYGGTSGLVSIEDLLEQIVGDIQDEYDLEEDWIHKKEDGTFIVDARLQIEELEESIGVQLEREKFDTVGGLIIYLLGRIPNSGEEVISNSVKFRIISSDERKINKVHVKVITDDENKAEKA